jgi:hypothetical protein
MPIKDFNITMSRKPIDQVRLQRARDWYVSFTGKNAVKMDDRELLSIYDQLQEPESEYQ